MPTCSQPLCPMATTGVCLEGHTQGCPHLIADEISSAEDAAAPADAPPLHWLKHEPYRFHSGEKLTTLEASRLMRAKPVKMIFCAGAQQAGKTTFLAKIGEMFRNGTIEDFRFSGSKTLCAFERITWLATITSGAGQADTKRTYRVERDTFYHIQVQPVDDTKKRKELLITDLPGEIFPTLIATREVCEEQLALARADYVVFFIDCGTIIDTAKRHSERDTAYRFFSQIKASRRNAELLKVSIVFSRWDKISTHKNPEEHEDYCKLVEEDFIRRFGSTFGPVRFHRVAARPDAGSASNAEIQGIFSLWMEDAPPDSSHVVPQISNPARDFCAYGIK